MMTPQEEAQLRAVLIVAHRDYQKGLHLHAFYKVSNHATSDDLVQETFMKTWRYLVKGGRIDLMRAFLYRVLNDLIVDEYRKHKSSSLDLLQENGIELGADHSDAFFDILDGKAALLLIQQLPAKYQKVMRARYINGLSLSEISILTEQTKNTTAVQIHRGLKKLRVLYDAPKEEQMALGNAPLVHIKSEKKTKSTKL